MLTLNDAVKSGRLQEFIAEQEALGVGPVDRAKFDGLAATLIRARQSKGQTLRSPSGDGSTGKKIRQGNGRDASR